jgi:hypothetical protein
MGSENKNRFIPALRKAWSSMQTGAFFEMGKDEVTGAELRVFLLKSIETRSEKNRSVRAWNTLSPEAKDEALLAAFPNATYTRETIPEEGAGA